MPEANQATPAAKRTPPWLWPNVLGLDAPLVAVAWQYLVASAFSIRLRPIDYAALALIVWAIYSIDRLLDSKKLQSPETATARHRFYRRHFKPLAALTLAGCAGALYLVLRHLTAQVILPGVMLGLLVALYLFHRAVARGPILFVLPKELLSGFVFAFGTVLIGFAITADLIPNPRSRSLGILSPAVLAFGCLCSLNCAAISVWERAEDADNDPNAAAQLFPALSHHFAPICWGVTAVLALAAFRARDEVAFPIFAASALGCGLLSLLASSAAKFSSPTLRLLADVAVLAPAIAFLPLVAGR